MSFDANVVKFGVCFDGSSDDGAERERALWARVARAVLAQARPEDRALELLRYLEAFPTGRHNRRAAEAVEAALWRVADRPFSEPTPPS